MIFTAAYRALWRIFTKDYRTMLYKALGFTFFLLVFLWLILREFFLTRIWPFFADFLPNFPDWLGFLGIISVIIFSIGLAFIMTLLIAPISAMIGGFFMDNAAEIIEKSDYPKDKKGIEMPLGRSLIIALRFALISIIGNVLLLILLFIPGLHFIGFYLFNGYLLGREYFEFAACRHMGENDASVFYKKHRFIIFLAGLIIMVFISIPLLNLLTPLFAAAFMTHLYKSLMQKA